MNTLPISPNPTSFPTSSTNSAMKSSTTNSPLKSSIPVNTVASSFVERRSGRAEGAATERRQFSNSHAKLSPDARALAEAIDRYKADNRRRYITFEEMLEVITQLGYQKQA